MNSQFYKEDISPDDLPVDIDKNSLKYLGKAIKQYLNLFLNVMIIPKELKANKKDLKKAIKVVKELVKKLEKGDKSVLKEDI